MSENGRHRYSENIETLFSSGTVILFTCGASNDYPLLSVSKNVEDILGFSSSYFLQDKNGWSKRIHPADRKEVKQSFKKVVEKGGEAINEYRFKRRDGAYIWLRDEIKRVKEEDAPVVIYGSSMDITERKRAELKLKESKKQYQAIVEHIKDVTYSIDRNGKITFLNKAWHERTGYSIKESLGEVFADFIHPDDRESFECMLEQLQERDAQSQITIVRFLTRDSDFFWAELYAKRLQDETDRKSIITGTVIDVSEDIARQKERETINKQLEERVRQRSKDLRKEITKRKEAESELQQRLLYEQAISQCSNLLLKSTDLKALKNSLEVLQEVSGSDRVYIYKNKERNGKLYLDPVMEVCASGVAPQIIDEEPLVTYSEIKWWHQKLQDGEIINTHVEDLPQKEREILSSQQVKSVLVIPILVGGKWYGYMGFADTKTKRIWTKQEVRLLKMAAEIISAFKKRRMIEETLVEQRNYTETILDSLPSIYLLMDEDLRFIQWNKNAARYTGYTQEELKSKNAFDLVVPEDRQKLVEATERVREDRGSGSELTLQTKSGEQIPYFWRGYYIELNQREYFLCVGLNIHKQKESERELMQEKRFNEALIESLPGIFYMVDQEGNYLRWNKNFEEELGYSADEIKDMSVADFYSDKEFQRISEGIQQVYEKGVAELETTIITKEGDRIPYYLTGKLLSKDGNDYLVGVGHDISEQQSAREKLQKSEELFRNLFLKAPAAIAKVSPDNKVQNINQSFEELFGYTEEEIKGKDIDKLLVPEQEKADAPKMPGTNYSMDSFHKEARRLAKGGKVVDVFVAGIPVYVNGESIAGFGMYIDITDQKRYEEEIYSSLKEKHVLLQEIHHRVKNNLAVVSGLIQLQMYETDNEVVRETLKESESRIQTMALIHEKLYKSQNLSRISCDSYIGDLVETIRSTNDTDKDITVHKNIDDVQLSINKAVPFALLVNEVVTNAFKHAFEGKQNGTITIDLKRKEQQVQVNISDNGIGLPGDLDPKEVESLGLTLIHNFMDQLDGKGKMGSDNGTYLNLTFDIEDVNGSSASGLIDF